MAGKPWAPLRLAGDRDGAGGRTAWPRQPLVLQSGRTTVGRCGGGVSPHRAGVQPVPSPAGNSEVAPSHPTPGARRPLGLLPGVERPPELPPGSAPWGGWGTSTDAMVRERCRGRLILPASAELQQGELVSSFLPFRSPSLSLSSALCENPALFLTGEDPGRHRTSAHAQGQRDACLRRGRAALQSTRRLCSTGTRCLLRPVEHLHCEQGSTGQVPREPPQPPSARTPPDPALPPVWGWGWLVTGAGFAQK